MSHADIAELLAVAYSLHCLECEARMEKPVAPGEFHELYKKHIQEFRHLMHADDGREING